METSLAPQPTGAYTATIRHEETPPAYNTHSNLGKNFAGGTNVTFGPGFFKTEAVRTTSGSPQPTQIRADAEAEQAGDSGERPALVQMAVKYVFLFKSSNGKS